MGTLTTLHSVLSNTVWLFFLIVGIWGILRAIRGGAVDASYLGALAIGELLFVVQAILGTTLLIGGSRPGSVFMHLLYGTFGLVFLPFVYLAWLRGDDSNRAQWVLGFATLFLFGIALRAISTAV